MHCSSTVCRCAQTDACKCLKSHRAAAHDALHCYHMQVRANQSLQSLGQGVLQQRSMPHSPLHGGGTVLTQGRGIGAVNFGRHSQQGPMHATHPNLQAQQSLPATQQSLPAAQHSLPAAQQSLPAAQQSLPASEVQRVPHIPTCERGAVYAAQQPSLPLHAQQPSRPLHEPPYAAVAQCMRHSNPPYAAQQSSLPLHEQHQTGGQGILGSFNPCSRSLGSSIPVNHMCRLGLAGGVMVGRSRICTEAKFGLVM